MNPAERARRENTISAFYKAMAAHTAPLEPSTDANLYVEDLHFDSRRDQIKQLARAVRDTGGSEVFYFTGQRGTGKSTELLRLKDLLQRDGARVFYADMIDYVPETAPVEIGDFLITLMGAWSDVTGASATRESYWTRIRTFLGSDVEWDKFGLKAGVGDTGLEVKFALKENPTFKRRLQEAAAGRLQAVVADARQYMSESLAALNRSGSSQAPIVFIVDSLERLRGVSADAMSDMFRHVVTLFEAYRDILRLPGVSVVYSVPPYLAFLSNVKSNTRLFSLASVRVFERRTEAGGGGRRESGLAKMRELVERRFPQWREVLQAAALDELAAHSGGDLREYFIRFMQASLSRAYEYLEELPLAADHAAIQETISEARGDYRRAVFGEDLPLLAKVYRDQDIALDTRAVELPAIARMFDIRAVLSYRNGDEWYDVHPLLQHAIAEYERSNQRQR